MIKKIFLIALLVSVTPIISVAQVNTEEQLNFNLVSAFLYYPGEKPELFLYADDYTTKKVATTYDFDISVYKIRDVEEFFSKQKDFEAIGIEGTDTTNLLYLTDEILSFRKTVKSDNKNGNVYIYENFPLKISETGAYLIKAKYKNQIAYCGVIISRVGVISQMGSNTVLTQVVDRETGEAVATGNIGFYIKGKKVAGGELKKGGIFFSEFDVPGELTDEMIVGKSKDDVIISNPISYFNPSRNKVVYTYTNQPVYRTDSDVRFKCIIRAIKLNGYEPVANRTVKVIINGNGDKVFESQYTTNDNGSIDGTYHIAKDAVSGDYEIKVYLSENENYTSNFAFYVEQYKKPEYEVNVSTNKIQYYGNDTIRGTINGKYYFGSPVTDADVTYRIYSYSYFVPWWKFSDNSWWYNNFLEISDTPETDYDHIYTGYGKTDSEGNFEFSYIINEDFKVKYNKNDRWRGENFKSDKRYNIFASVIDKSRREISGKKNLYVTRGGYYTNAKVDKYFYKPNDKANLIVNAKDYDDKPVATNFEARIIKYKYIDKKISSQIIKSVKGNTGSDGKGIVNFNADNEGSYILDVIAQDDKSNVISTSTYFYVYKDDISWLNSNESKEIQIITDKDSYKKGDVCKALFILKQPHANLLVSGQTENIVFYKVINVTNGKAEVEIPITDSINKNMTICANYVSNSHFINHTKTVIIIPEDKFLTVELTPSREIYNHKETGEMKVRVLDNKGNPVSNAEVSLGMIDESIYAVHDDFTKDIREVFYSSIGDNIYTTYNENNRQDGRSHLQTIFEKYNMKKMSESELGTIIAVFNIESTGDAVRNYQIIIDGEYSAGSTDDSGKIDFKLPEGKHEIGIFTDEGLKKAGDVLVKKGSEISVSYKIKENVLLAQTGEYDLFQDKTNRKKPAAKDYAKIDIYEDISHKRYANIVEYATMINPNIRSEFRDAILWMPYVTTDADGYATVEVNYPDNLTQWRLTARVVTQDTKVGENIVKVITRKNLFVRMETPRFLQSGDNVTITTIIHNYLDSEKNVKVKFKAEGVEFTGENEKTITLGKNMDEKIDWNIKVTGVTGEAKLYCEALTNKESDAVELKVPLQPRGLKFIQSDIADLSGDNQTETKSYAVPSFIDKSSAKLSFSISPSIASALLNSLDQLIGYPYGCVEQTMSKFLPSIIVADAYTSLNIQMNEKSRQELPKAVNAGLERLYTFQHSDGGWGWWQNDKSQGFMTAYVLYGLNIAKNLGYKIKNSVIISGQRAINDYYRKENDPVTKAYMMYVMSTFGIKDVNAIAGELGNLEKSVTDDYSLSLMALAYNNIGNKDDALRIVNKLETSNKSMTDDFCYWEGGKYKYDWRGDKVQTTSMVLKALVNIKPSSNLIDKSVKWLLQQRYGNAWHSTQETANIVYSMIDYLKQSKELEADFTAKVYLNNELCYTKTFTKEDIFKKDSVVNISYDKLNAGENQIRIEKTGKGKLYYSSQLLYFDNSDNIVSSESGFRVEKEYYLLDQYKNYNDEKIDYRKKYFNGEVKSGDLIFVKLKVYAKDKDLKYFMLEDPLPAGCEVVKDDRMFYVEDEKEFTKDVDYGWSKWYADKNIRDDKMVFFATNLYSDVNEFSYILRAQIPGEYTINPTNAELMYYPEYRGNTAGYTIKIRDK